MRFTTVFNTLHKCYGPQHWWPGETPFEIMVGAVLTQNTAWTNVEKVIANLKQADSLDAERIADTPPDKLAAWLRPAGYFNIKAKRLHNYCAWYLEHGGFDALAEWETQALRDGLLSVNGVGQETADDILLYAFERPVFVIDAYTRRIFSRLALVDDAAPYDHLRRQFEQAIHKETNKKETGHRAEISGLFNEYHALIVIHGKDVCRPRPRCEQCCLKRKCPYPSMPAYDQ
jgi:endonuclease-3 related protein